MRRPRSFCHVSRRRARRALRHARRAWRGGRRHPPDCGCHGREDVAPEPRRERADPVAPPLETQAGRARLGERQVAAPPLDQGAAVRGETEFLAHRRGVQRRDHGVLHADGRGGPGRTQERDLCLRPQRPIMRAYVTLTGPTDGAPAAGGRSCRLPPEGLGEVGAAFPSLRCSLPRSHLLRVVLGYASPTPLEGAGMMAPRLACIVTLIVGLLGGPLGAGCAEALEALPDRVSRARVGSRPHTLTWTRSVEGSVISAG